MKSKLLSLLVLLSCSARLSQAQIVNILNENFNNGFPAGWQAIDGDLLTPAAAVSDIGPSFSSHIDYDTLLGGDSILVATSWFNPVGKANNYLILPQVTLQANGNFLVFEAKSKDPSYAESFEVLVSTTTSDTSNFNDTLYSETFLSPNWTQYIIDLDAYVGQSIFIAIQHSSNDKFILCLDNFVVYADLQNSISENQHPEPKVNIYPNPASDQITIDSESPIESISIYDLSGKLISNNTYSSSLSLIYFPLSDYTNGVYLIEIGTTDRKVMRKFIKQ